MLNVELGTLVCYKGYTWQSDPDTGVCFCDNWYGWIGSDCTDLGRGSKYLLSSASIQLFIALVRSLEPVEKF